MMIWIRRSVDDIEWKEAQARFEELFTSMNAPRGMVLIAADNSLHAGAQKAR
jgi:hypothetical protein